MDNQFPEANYYPGSFRGTEYREREHCSCCSHRKIRDVAWDRLPESGWKAPSPSFVSVYVQPRQFSEMNAFGSEEAKKNITDIDYAEKPKISNARTESSSLLSAGVIYAAEMVKEK